MLRLSVNWTVICVVPWEFGGTHALHAGDGGELALERRGHRRSHGFRTGAGQRGGHLDVRIVHGGQRGHRQRSKGHHAEQQDGEHDQRGHDRAFDEDAGDIMFRASERQVIDFAGRNRLYLRAGKQAQLAVGDHRLAWRDTFGDHRLAADRAGLR